MKAKTLTILLVLTLSINAGIGEGQSTEGALPVELTTFTASVNSQNVQLNWATATEVDNYGFEIQRASFRKDGTTTVHGEWIKIGFVEGSGNSNSPKEYLFIDESVFQGNYKYRLKQINTDGSFKYSKIIEVEFGAIPTEYVLKQNYPNPFNPSTVISYSIPTNSFVSVKVYDLLGNLITTLVSRNQETGIYKVTFTANELSNGVYFYRISANNFISTKKMILIK